MQQRETRETLNPALLAVGQDPDVLAMRLQVGTYYPLHGEQPIKIGQTGWPDVLCLVSVTVTPEMVGQVIAVPVAAEMKTADGRQSSAQKAYQAALTKRGGIYQVIRSAPELVDLISKVKKWQHKKS